jgi:hypothetical protein
MSQAFEQQRPYETWRPLGLSFLTHLLLLSILLFTWRSTGTVGQGEPDRRVQVVLTVAQPATTEYLTEADVEQASQTSSAALADAATSVVPAEPPPLELAEPQDLPGPAIPTELSNLDVNQMTEVPNSRGQTHEFELSPEDLKMIAADQNRFQALQPVGNPARISVFGSGQLEGRKFVFVIDRSQSMGSTGLGVIERARTELSNAINQLELNHSFQVVAYNDRTVTIDRRQLLPATSVNKQLVPEFLGNLLAFGSTSHENGLIIALTFKPDVIVLMTDGGFPELNRGQLDLIRKMAGGQTEIHCVQFGTGLLQDTDNFMMRLARENQGSFRYHDVAKW